MVMMMMMMMMMMMLFLGGEGWGLDPKATLLTILEDGPLSGQWAQGLAPVEAGLPRPSSNGRWDSSVSPARLLSPPSPTPVVQTSAVKKKREKTRATLYFLSLLSLQRYETSFLYGLL